LGLLVAGLLAGPSYQGSLIATLGISVFVSRAAARQPGAHTTLANRKSRGQQALVSASRT